MSRPTHTTNVVEIVRLVRGMLGPKWKVAHRDGAFVFTDGQGGQITVNPWELPGHICVGGTFCGKDQDGRKVFSSPGGTYDPRLGYDVSIPDTATVAQAAQSIRGQFLAQFLPRLDVCRKQCAELVTAGAA